MKFYYNLPNSNQEIELQLSNPEVKCFSIIYGPNGVGKSTFANAIYKDEKNKFFLKKNSKDLKNYQVHLFNRIYINENVYISNESGYDSTTNQNQKWCNVFLGNKINLEIEKLQKITTLKNDIKIDFKLLDLKKLNSVLKNEFSNEDLSKTFNPIIDRKSVV